MKPYSYLTLVAAATLSLPGMAQSSGYRDASTVDGALGMLKVTQVSTEAMRRRCVAAFPQKADAIHAELAKWKASETKNFARLDARWPKLRASEPAIDQVLTAAAASVDKQVDGWLAEAGGPAKFGPFCERHFAELSSGIWRKRTPKVYRYLDKLP